MYAFNLSSTRSFYKYIFTGNSQRAPKGKITKSSSSNRFLLSFAVGFLHFLFLSTPYIPFQIVLSFILNTTSFQNAISIKKTFLLLSDNEPKQSKIVFIRSNVASQFKVNTNNNRMRFPLHISSHTHRDMNATCSICTDGTTQSI